MKKRKAKITNIRNKKGNVIQTLQTLIGYLDRIL